VQQNKNFKDWVVFEDDDYMVINKPPYFSTLEDRTGASSILELAKKHHEGAQVCHRLDKETSGALLISKHNEAYKHASTQFADRSIEKTYHAVADGLHNLENEKIDFALHVAASGNVTRISKTGKPSTTTVRSMRLYKYHTLMECKPVTGRMHQIRVHLAKIGAPLVADGLYGGKDLFLSSIKRNYRPKLDVEERPLMPRVALHAYSLRFTDFQGNVQEIASPYPKDFRTVITQLEKNS
jgi:23S rRNA pseudouridine955/2504/2580 synthase